MGSRGHFPIRNEQCEALLTMSNGVLPPVQHNNDQHICRIDVPLTLTCSNQTGSIIFAGGC